MRSFLTIRPLLRPAGLACVVGLAACSTLVSPVPGVDDTSLTGSDDDDDDDDDRRDTFDVVDTASGADSDGSSGNHDVDPDLQNCTPLNVPLTAIAPSTGTFDVSEVAVRLFAFTDTTSVSDFALPDGTEISGYLTFDLYDANGIEQCSILFDVNTATPITNLANFSADAWAGWTFTLDATQGRAIYYPSGATSAAYCGQLASAFDTSGSRDPRAFVQTFFSPLSLAVGPLTGSHATDMQTALDGAGLDWANDYAPYAVAAHLSYGSSAPTPWGAVIRWDSTCSTLVEDSSGSLIAEPKPSNAWPGGITEMFGLYVVQFQ